jgi:hypothetical protein
MDVQFLNRSRKGLLRKTGLLILLVLPVAVPAASSGKPSLEKIRTRSVIERHKDIFESSGTDCGSKVIHQRFWFEQGVVEKRQSLQLGPNCEAYAGPVETTRIPLPSIEIPASISGPSLNCGPYQSGGFNWIHTSWTFQVNVTNTDVAWLRSSFFKLWNCSSTWWSDYPGDVYAWSGRSSGFASNNTIPTWPYIDWDCSRQSFDCYQAVAETKANFTLKVIVGYQKTCSFAEQINVYSYRDGSWFVDFWLTVIPPSSCGGYHNSTAAKVSDSESAGYGGKTDPTTKMSVAVPYVSG